MADPKRWLQGGCEDAEREVLEEGIFLDPPLFQREAIWLSLSGQLVPPGAVGGGTAVGGGGAAPPGGPALAGAAVIARGSATAATLGAGGGAPSVAPPAIAVAKGLATVAFAKGAASLVAVAGVVWAASGLLGSTMATEAPRAVATTGRPAVAAVEPEVRRIPPAPLAATPAEAPEPDPLPPPAPRPARPPVLALAPPPALAPTPAILAAAAPPEPPGSSPALAPAVGPMLEESRVLERARDALRRGDASTATAQLDEARALFPRSGLDQERQALRVEALWIGGDKAGARAAAAAFLRAYPESPLAARVQSFAP